MSKREKLADEAYEDLDRIFPGTKRAKKPADKYKGSPLVLIPDEEAERDA